MEQQPAAPPPANNYDFILNPQKPPKKSLAVGVGGNPFVVKILFLVGGVVVLMMVAAVVLNLLFGNKTNLDTIVSIAQSEQELVRVSTKGSDAVSQPVKEAAVNTQLTIKSHQLAWVSFMAKHGKKVEAKQLALTKDATTDKRLTAASQTSTFDTTYTTIMRTQLEAYEASIKEAYNGATNKQERTLLSRHYNEVKLLLKQWPSSTLGLAYY